MTDLDEYLAVNVMGWEKRDGAWWDEKGRPLCAVGQSSTFKENWIPSANIEQAFMCLEKFNGWMIGKNEPTFTAVMQEHGWCGAMNESLPLTVSLACARAKGWKE